METEYQGKLLFQLTEQELRNIVREEMKGLLSTNVQIVDTPLKTYSKKDLAEIFGVTTQTIADRERAGDIPKRMGKIGKFPFWTHEQVSGMIQNTRK
jgi:hypothetical protein